MDSLDNFSGKVDGEEDDLKGKAVKEELDGFAGKLGGDEDDLLTGDAVTALDSNPLLDSNQTPAAVDLVEKGMEERIRTLLIGGIRRILTYPQLTLGR